MKIGDVVATTSPRAFKEVMDAHGAKQPFWLGGGTEAALGDVPRSTRRPVLPPRARACSDARGGRTPSSRGVRRARSRTASASRSVAPARASPKPVMALLRQATSKQLLFGGNGTDCGHGLDNEGDRKIDFPADPDCTSAKSTSEGAPPSMPVTWTRVTSCRRRVTAAAAGAARGGGNAGDGARAGALALFGALVFARRSLTPMRIERPRRPGARGSWSCSRRRPGAPASPAPCARHRRRQANDRPITWSSPLRTAVRPVRRPDVGVRGDLVQQPAATVWRTPYPVRGFQVCTNEVCVLTEAGEAGCLPSAGLSARWCRTSSTPPHDRRPRMSFELCVTLPEGANPLHSCPVTAREPRLRLYSHAGPVKRILSGTPCVISRDDRLVCGGAGRDELDQNGIEDASRVASGGWTVSGCVLRRITPSRAGAPTETARRRSALVDRDHPQCRVSPTSCAYHTRREACGFGRRGALLLGRRPARRAPRRSFHPQCDVKRTKV